MPAHVDVEPAVTRSTASSAASPTTGRTSPARIAIDPENAAKGLGQLVLTVVELLRELIERQAGARLDAGSLDDEQIEDLGPAVRGLDDNVDVLVEAVGLTRDDLNPDLRPLGTLL